MERDRLFICPSEFRDASFPGRTFYCQDCMTLKGLLSAFPERAARLEIIPTAHAHPRLSLVELIGEQNQSLPVLVLADDSPGAVASAEYRGVRFINKMPQLLKALHDRHGFPEPHL